MVPAVFWLSLAASLVATDSSNLVQSDPVEPDSHDHGPWRPLSTETTEMLLGQSDQVRSPSDHKQTSSGWPALKEVILRSQDLKVRPKKKAHKKHRKRRKKHARHINILKIFIQRL